MNTILAIDGGWQYCWTEYRGELHEVPTLGNWRAAIVPGDVHLDLMRDGLLDDPFVGMNADHARWMETKDWWFRTEFNAPAEAAGRSARLVFHGLDTFATVWLNGKLVGRSANMFVRHEFDATDALKSGGANELVVRLAAPVYSIAVDPAQPGLGVWSPERLFVRKAQMSFGWDIAPRLVTVGIWRPVELRLADSARITDLHCVLERFEGDDALVRLETEIEWLGGQAADVRLASSVYQVDWAQTVRVQPGINRFVRSLRIGAAPRWWPIGYGRPGLIDASVSVESEGRTLDARAVRTGLRTIELVQEPQPSGATSFRFRCNGRDIFITGLNWTPPDAIFARMTPQRTTRLLEMLAGVGCNMLRVWGGGIYESDHFYAECDRLGIMIWQDFMMACGRYPQTDAFAAAIEIEARQVVGDLRNHPCIAVWAGDNECDQWPDWFGLDYRLAQDNRLTRQVLPAICGELSPEVPYVPTSPWSPSGAHWTSQAEGDYHCYCHGQSHRRSGLWAARCRFMSEFGRLSLPSMKLIRKYFPKGTDWPLTNAMWRYHGSDTIRTGYFRVADKILDELKAAGRPAPADIRQAVRQSQQVQADAIVELIEHYCDDPEFGGFLLWNVTDCWPQQSDSLIDYEGEPKAAFKRLRRAFERARKRRPMVGPGQSQPCMSSEIPPLPRRRRGRSATSLEEMEMRLPRGRTQECP